MKLKSILATAVLVLGLAFNAAAEVKHEHAAKAGSTGGKLITEVEPHVKFLVTKDKKVELRFIDDANKMVAPADQVISVTLGERSKPTKLTFTKEGDKLVSDKMVPEGNDYPTVVQIKTDAKAKPINARFNLNMRKCPTCSSAEYACTCEHGDEKGAVEKDAKKGKK